MIEWEAVFASYSPREAQAALAAFSTLRSAHKKTAAFTIPAGTVKTAVPPLLMSKTPSHPAVNAGATLHSSYKAPGRVQNHPLKSLTPYDPLSESFRIPTIPLPCLFLMMCIDVVRLIHLTDTLCINTNLILG